MRFEALGAAHRRVGAQHHDRLVVGIDPQALGQQGQAGRAAGGWYDRAFGNGAHRDVSVVRCAPGLLVSGQRQSRTSGKSSNRVRM
ncbi:hypothetical protein GALL_510000 [mine drainage metagenome]|uniref:Uncharacterized protein n=1 Tax=mine drainage metagenome TaxID=410659 RepID=A0A1J5PIQ4_9ZZZZ